MTSATRAALAALLTLALAPVVAAQPAPLREAADPGARFRGQTFRPKVPIAWNRLYDNDELIAHFRRLVAAYPRFLTLEEIGRSSQGRPLYLITVQNPGTGPAREKAAMFIDANIHGNEIQGGEVCLYTVWYLMELYGRDPLVTRLVNRRVFYVQPVTNVDARVHWFSRPSTPHWPRSGLAPYDDDRDGRFDEDGYDDLDGDGEITRMRKRVPLGRGTHRQDPRDPRLLIPIEPGQQGDWLQLGWEGIDNDGDGRINEDLPGGYDMNRNWPGDWRPGHLQRGAGDYPLSEPETRAVADFVLARPHIAGYQSYHNAGGMVLRGPGNATQPKYLGADRRVYDRLGKLGEDLLPFYRYLIIHKDLYSVYGGEVTWAAEELGIIAFTNELWTPARLTGKAGPRFARSADDRLARLRRADALLAGEVYRPYREVQHPTLGTVEVGGYRQTYGRVPPAFLLEESYHRNTVFSLAHADAMPRVTLGEVSVTSLGDGLWQIDAEAINDKLIPTRTALMTARRIGARDCFRLSGEGAVVVAGGKLTGRVDRRLVPKAKDPARVWFDEGIGSHGRVMVRWLVQGAAGARVAVSYRAVKGGHARRVVELRAR